MQPIRRSSSAVSNCPIRLSALIRWQLSVLSHLVILATYYLLLTTNVFRPPSSRYFAHLLYSPIHSPSCAA